jgi:hypothetical protein
MSDQPILCEVSEVSEVIFRVSNRRASVKLRLLGVVNVARCNCVSNVCASAIDVVVQTLSRSGFMIKSLCIGDLRRPIHIIPSFTANLANHGRNLANWSLNLAISDANLASESSYLPVIMAICEVSEVISLPSHARTRTCARAGEIVFKYRSGRKITSHNLVTSQLGLVAGGRSIGNQPNASDHRTTLPHVARSLASRPMRRISRSSRQWANSGPTTRLSLWQSQAPNDGSSPRNHRVLGPREQPRD